MANKPDSSVHILPPINFSISGFILFYFSTHIYVSNTNLNTRIWISKKWNHFWLVSWKFKFNFQLFLSLTRSKSSNRSVKLLDFEYQKVSTVIITSLDHCIEDKMHPKDKLWSKIRTICLKISGSLFEIGTLIFTRFASIQNDQWN